MTDIIITWPKARPLTDYLAQLERAELAGEHINFRVSTIPSDIDPGDRCYVCHNHYIRGWNLMVAVEYKEDVIDPVSGDFMRPGIFLVRDPHWYPMKKMKPKSPFQGYRYVKPEVQEKFAEYAGDEP